MLNDSQVGDARNALVLAQACSFAYLDEAEGVSAFRSRLGLEARFISADNTQVYVAQNEALILVAFRGSQCPFTLDGLKDWLLTNANNYLVLPEGQIGTDFAAAGVGTRFHRGFLEALEETWVPLYRVLDEAMKVAERPLWVTGHSLGGALALLAAWRFQRHFLPVSAVVTFGAPMIGNEAAARAFEEEFGSRILRYVNLEDPVPLLPSVSLVANAYAHCPHEIPLTSEHEAAVPAADVLHQSIIDQGGADPVVANHEVERLWDAIQHRLEAHLIDRYHARLKQRCQGVG